MASCEKRGSPQTRDAAFSDECGMPVASRTGARWSIAFAVVPLSRGNVAARGVIIPGRSQP